MAKLILPADERKAVPLWRNVNFQILWSSVAAAGFGDRLIQLAAWSMLGFYAMGEHAPAASSIQAGVSAFFFIPYVVLGTFAGWLADTIPRKWIMFASDQGRAIVLLLAAFMAPGVAGEDITVLQEGQWKVFGLVLLVGIMAAMFSPAKAATVPQIAPLQQLQPANAIVLGISVIASLIGLVVGQPLIRGWSVRGGLVVGAVVFSVAGALFLFMRIPKARRLDLERKGEFERMLDAVRYTLRHRPILELTLLTVLFWAAANVFIAALAALCKVRFDYPDGTTYLMGTLGVGMLSSSLWIAWINTRRESSWFAMFNLALCGLCILLVARNPWFWLNFPLSFGVGFFGNTTMICVATLTQSIAPNYIRGRVFGVRDFISTSSAVVVNLIIWRLPNADRWMVPALYVLSAVLILVAIQGVIREMPRGPFPNRTANVLNRFARFYLFVWHRLKWIGREHVPESGPVILAANHTTGLDPFLMQAPTRRLIRWVMLETYKFRLAGILWRAINPITIKQGAGDLGPLRQVLAALKNGDVVGIFPEGGLQRDHRNLQPFEPGIGMLAVRSGAVIVPVWIEGTPQTKSMLWHFLKPSRSTVIFGEPYKPDPGMEYQAIADDLRARMLDLARSAVREPAVAAATHAEPPSAAPEAH